jgi:hypothetical protein
MGELVRNELKCSQAVKNFMTTSIEESNSKVIQILKEIVKQKIANINNCVNEVKVLESSLNNALIQIRAARNHFTQDSTSIAIQPHINNIKNERRKVANHYEKGVQLLQLAKREAVGYEKDEEIKQLLTKTENTIKNIKQIQDTIAEIALDADRTLKVVQRKEDYIRRVDRITGCVNEIKSIETSLNDVLTKISNLMGLFTKDNTSDTIQPHFNSIRSNAENVVHSYKKGLQLQQTAKQESIGFERDDKISRLLAEIDAATRKIQEDYNTIQEKVSDASQTLKTVQRRERRRKTTIIISIIAVLLLLVAVVVRNC